ncbi:MAG: IPExxxVDY family protein [Chitinophagales bacterium]|nr:IPExxxVDY family protein [Chitinophagales bacterium]
MQAKRKYYIIDDDEFIPEEKFHLIGISGTVRFYKLCYHLNHFLDIDLSMDEPINISIPGKKSNVSFLRLSYTKMPGQHRFEVIINKTSSDVLVKQLKSYDILCKLPFDFSSDEIKKICSKIKQLKEVILVNHVNVETIKEIHKLCVLQ